MANRLYNKQVSPKGYQTGGRVAKMGGGMMMNRPMMNKGGRTKVMTDAQKEAAKRTGAKVKKAAKQIRNKANFNVKESYFVNTFF